MINDRKLRIALIATAVLGLGWAIFFSNFIYSTHINEWSTAESIFDCWLITFPAIGALVFLFLGNRSPSEQSVTNYDFVNGYHNEVTSVAWDCFVISIAGTLLAAIIGTVDYFIWDSPKMDFVGSIFEFGFLTAGISVFLVVMITRFVITASGNTSWKKLKALLALAGITWAAAFVPSTYEAYTLKWPIETCLLYSWLMTFPLLGTIAYIAHDANGNSPILSDFEGYNSFRDILMRSLIQTGIGAVLALIISIIDAFCWKSPKVDFFGSVIEMGLLTSGLSMLLLVLILKPSTQFFRKIQTERERKARLAWEASPEGQEHLRQQEEKRKQENEALARRLEEQKR